MEIVDCEDLHMNGGIGLGCLNRAGQIPGEEDRCQYEESEDAESEEELQVVRGVFRGGSGVIVMEFLLAI